MNAEQKQRANELLAAWRTTAHGIHADAMAALLQELIDAHEVLAAPVRRLETTFRLLINTPSFVPILVKKMKGRNHDRAH